MAMSGSFRSLNRNLKFRAIMPTYTPKYTSTFAYIQVLNDRSHPLYTHTLRRYEQRDQSGLWWSATTMVYGKKRVIRSWSCRRIRQAFSEALKARGLDKNGKPIAKEPGMGLEHAGEDERIWPLYGTLRITAKQEAEKTKYAELREDCDRLVTELLKQCANKKELKKKEPMANKTSSSPATPRSSVPLHALSAEVILAEARTRDPKVLRSQKQQSDRG